MKQTEPRTNTKSALNLKKLIAVVAANSVLCLLTASLAVTGGPNAPWAALGPLYMMGVTAAIWKSIGWKVASIPLSIRLVRFATWVLVVVGIPALLLDGLTKKNVTSFFPPVFLMLVTFLSFRWTNSLLHERQN